MDVIVEPIATLAAMKTGRPSIQVHARRRNARLVIRSAWRMYFKDGVKKDGRIIARQITSYADAGAYNRHTPYAVTKHRQCAGPYRIPNVSSTPTASTQPQPGSAMRGFGVTPLPLPSSTNG